MCRDRARGVFAALAETDDVDVDARAEPVLAITILAGMASVLITPAWGRIMNDSTVDWLVVFVLTFVGGLLYGAAGYFLLGLALWLGAKAVGVDPPFRIARQIVAFAALPLALSLLVVVPAIAIGYGADWFTTGGADDGERPDDSHGRRPRVRGVVARARRARPADDVPTALAWRRGCPAARRRPGGCVRRAPERAQPRCLVSTVSIAPTAWRNASSSSAEIPYVWTSSGKRRSRTSAAYADTASRIAVARSA